MFFFVFAPNTIHTIQYLYSLGEDGHAFVYAKEAQWQPIKMLADAGAKGLLLCILLIESGVPCSLSVAPTGQLAIRGPAMNQVW